MQLQKIIKAYQEDSICEIITNDRIIVGIPRMINLEDDYFIMEADDEFISIHVDDLKDE